MAKENRKKIERMTKDEIKEYAKKEYGIKLSTNDLKKEMIDQFFDELEKNSKKPESKKQKNESEKSESFWSRNKSFWITTIAVLLLFAILIGGIKYYNQQTVKPYNGFEFYKQDMLWVTQAQMGDQPYELPFYYHPSEVENIISPQGVEQPLLKAAKNNRNVSVFITVNPDLHSKAVVAAVEISRLTGSRYNILNLPTRGALTSEPEDKSANADNPIVTCNNANNETIVIQIQQGPENIIYEEDNGCIKLQGSNEENIKRVADRFAYQILGIME